MKKRFLYCLLFLFPLAIHAQTWEWERDLNSFCFSSNVNISDIAIDKKGNSYMLIGDSSNLYDASSNTFIWAHGPSLFKISPEGNVLWKASIQSSMPSETICDLGLPNSAAVKIAPDGHIFVCANLPGALNFGNIALPKSSRPSYQIDFQNNFWTQLFLAECDTSGKWLNASVLGDVANIAYVNDMVIDKNFNVFINGSYGDSLIIGNTIYVADPYSAYDPPSSSFLCSFKMNGTVNWVDNFPHLLNYTKYLNSDQNGNLYFTIEDSSESEYIYKIQSNGALSSIKNLPTKGSNSVLDIKIDKLGNIYVAGDITGPVDFGNGVILKPDSNINITGFLVKYDTGFNAQWGKLLNGRGSNGISNICINDSGSLYALGYFFQNLQLGDSTYNENLSFFIAKFTSTGQITMGTAMPVLPGPAYGINIIPDSSGNLIVEGTTSYGVQFGCESLYPPASNPTFLAKLNPYPLIFKKNAFCSDDSFTCTSDTSLYHNLTWKFSDGTTQTGNEIAHFSKANGYYHFTLYATNSVGCQISISDSFKHPAPPVAAFSTKDSVACEFTKVILNDISQTDTIAPGNWPQDTWSFGDGTVSKTNKGVTKIYQDTGTFTIKLSYNNGFCSTDTSMNITVIPAPRPGFRVANFSKVGNSGDTATLAGCPPMPVQVTDQSQGTVTGWEYVVQKVIPLPLSKGDTVRTPSFSYDFLTPGQYAIHQYLTGPSGCVTEDSITIIVNPLPTVVYTGADSICFGSAIQLGGLPKAGYIYSWSAVPRGFYSNLGNPVDTPKANTVYDLKETIAATGCTDSGMAVSCFVQALPIASFAYQYVRGFEYKFTVKGAKNVSYLFDFGDSQHVSFNNTDSIIVHTFPGNGTYKVTLLAVSGTNLTCDAHQTDTVVINEPFSLNIFPNPFGLQTDINYMLLKPAHVRISITDDIGRQIGTLLDKQLGPGEYDTGFSGALWKTRPGMYFVLFQLDDTLIVKKIIQIDSIYY